MQEKRVSFRVSQDHIRRGARNNPAANPLALALRESGLMENPEVHRSGPWEPGKGEKSSGPTSIRRPSSAGSTNGTVEQR